MIRSLKIYVKRCMEMWHVCRHFTHRWGDFLRIACTLNAEKRNSYFHSVVLSYLKNILQPVVDKYKSQLCSSVPIADDAPIWVAWLQGEDKMPPIVRACYDSICRQANNHPVHLLHWKNIDEYLEIPDYIKDLHQQRIISNTHYSDILRVGLLAKHGGCWIDATVLVTAPIDFHHMSFFTLKQKAPDNYYVTNYQWTGFFMACSQNNILFQFMYDSFLYYWTKERRLINYFLIDYVIRVGYMEISEIRKLITDCPYSNPNLYWLQTHLNGEYDEAALSRVMTDTSFHKLRWKGKLVEQTERGSESFYGHIINTCTQK